MCVYVCVRHTLEFPPSVARCSLSLQCRCWQLLLRPHWDAVLVTRLSSGCLPVTCPTGMPWPSAEHAGCNISVGVSLPDKHVAGVNNTAPAPAAPPRQGTPVVQQAGSGVAGGNTTRELDVPQVSRASRAVYRPGMAACSSAEVAQPCTASNPCVFGVHHAEVQDGAILMCFGGGGGSCAIMAVNSTPPLTSMCRCTCLAAWPRLLLAAAA